MDTYIFVEILKINGICFMCRQGSPFQTIIVWRKASG